MTESKKEQVLKKEISMEMAEEVVGGGKEFFGRGGFGEGETELCGGGDFGGFNSNGGGSKPAGAGGGSKPAGTGGGVQPAGGTGNRNTQTNSNNSKGGQQNNVNAPNNLTIN